MYTVTFVYNFFTIVFGRLIFLVIFTPQGSHVCMCVFMVCIHVDHVCMPCMYVECMYLCMCVYAEHEGEWNLCNYGVCI